jgi:hypothetical protein
MNLLVGFRAAFEAPVGQRLTLRVTASRLYRACVNGEFSAAVRDKLDAPLRD